MAFYCILLPIEKITELIYFPIAAPATMETEYTQQHRDKDIRNSRGSRGSYNSDGTYSAYWGGNWNNMKAFVDSMPPYPPNGRIGTQLLVACEDVVLFVFHENMVQLTKYGDIVKSQN